MRVAQWNPTAFDAQIAEASMELLERAAAAVAEKAKSLCPVARHPNGGKLRDSIRVVKSKSRKNIRVYAGGYHQFYAKHVEFGSSKIQAHHYLLKGLHGANIMSILKG